MAFCLPPKDVAEFKKQILSGEIDPLKLAQMTSAQRHFFFAERFGDATATPMNSLFEEKLLMKNQQAGMVNWARKMMANDSPAQKDAIAKVKSMKGILTPKNEESFLAELAAKKLGTSVSYDEAKEIADLAVDVEKARAAMAAGGDRMEYGRAVVALNAFIGDLKRDADQLTFAHLKAKPFSTAATAAKRTLFAIGGNSKAILSSMDNSALLRQGLPTLLTHPSVWQRAARKSFVDLVKAFGSDQVINEMHAEIVSRPTYDLMTRAGLAVGVKEEAFPESLPEKIPVIGRAFRASEAAYLGFQNRTRADLFELYMRVWQKSGLDLDAAELKGIGTMVNAMTGRGYMGKLESSAELLNHMFFSPRNMAAKIHTLTSHLFDPTATSFARKQAAINLAKIIGLSAVVLLLAKAVSPASIDLNPLSPTFGKIQHKTRTQADVLLGTIADGLGITVNTYKHHPTTFDMTAGSAAYVTLAARVANRISKSLGHPMVNDKRDTWSDITNFVENKYAPTPQTVKAVMQNRTFSGQKPTIGNTIESMVVPLPIQNAMELEQERKRNAR